MQRSKGEQQHGRLQLYGTKHLPMLCALALLATPAKALPINFGYNQGNRDFDEIISEDFHLYHEHGVKGEAEGISNALHAAKPVLEAWVQSELHTPVSVTMSAITANASFANLLTNAIELQTFGYGGRDLAWHELTHTTMYAKVDNILGPAGALVHLPWMPAWFLEGLAEATSVSAGSTLVAGIERYYALTNNWPSYDRLHSLYHASAPESGYPIAGAFTSYVLKKVGPDKLPQLLEDFWDYTLPWWWPWTIVPYNRFLPLDAALDRAVGMTGEELYEAYKADSKAYWTKHARGTNLLLNSTPAKDLPRASELHSHGTNFRATTTDTDTAITGQLLFDDKTGFAHTFVPVDSPVGQTSEEGHLDIHLEQERDDDLDVYTTVFTESGDTKIPWFTRKARILKTFVSGDDLIWLEQNLATRKLCFTPKKIDKTPKVVCPLSVDQPQSLGILGARTMKNAPYFADEIWLRLTTETLRGDRHEIVRFANRKVTRQPWPMAAKPTRMAFSGSKQWMLTQEKVHTSLMQLDPDGGCLGIAFFEDLILDIEGNTTGDLVAQIYAGDHRFFKKLTKAEQALKPCKNFEGHTSPLIEAMREPGLSFAQAMTRADLWTSPHALTSMPWMASPPLDQEPVDIANKAASTTTHWRGAPKLAFPWIGADDALGYQLGLISVPLMDDMQNETVRLTALYGIESRFPYQELTVTSTRFKPTIQVAAYRQQTYNGQYYIRSEDVIQSSYYDEKGAKISVSRGFRLGDGFLGLKAGGKHAHLKPYLGPQQIQRGFLTELTSGASYNIPFSYITWSTSLTGDLAPGGLNDTFDYNRLGFQTSLASDDLPLDSRLSLGLEGARTRGRETFGLREFYRPLKTFVPGSGGGYNKNSFPIAGSGSLFTAQFGDTQARARTNWTVPLVEDFDYHFWILYMESLDVSAFYNYGGAWNGATPPQGFDKLTRAHGYSLDLQFENKGVRFNLGLGGGQVVGDDFQVYMTSGFDAIF